MYTEQLNEMGKRYFGSDFLGAFPLDKLPRMVQPGNKFIVNTQSANLPGEHWLAVSYKSSGIVYAFDPLGMYYPTHFVNYLFCCCVGCARVKFNRVTYQNPFTNTCGLHCILFLRDYYPYHTFV